MPSYFKYHRKFNGRDNLFDDKMFDEAEVVLLKMPDDILDLPRVYWVEDQKKIGPNDYEGNICDQPLPRGFTVPKHAQKITEKRFLMLTQGE